MTTLHSIYYLIPQTSAVIQKLKNVGIEPAFGYDYGITAPYVGINVESRKYYTYSGTNINNIFIPCEFINIAITLAVSVDQTTYVQTLDNLLNTQHEEALRLNA